MSKEKFSGIEKEVLIDLLMISHSTIEKKNSQLRQTKAKLTAARKRLRKIKNILSLQKNRVEAV
jgi:hypothetical protein